MRALQLSAPAPSWSRAARLEPGNLKIDREPARCLPREDRGPSLGRPLYQAFVPALVEINFTLAARSFLGLVFASYMAPSVLGAPIGGRFTPATAQRVGMVTFLAGMIGII
jgi:hypothetical protein